MKHLVTMKKSLGIKRSLYSQLSSAILLIFFLHSSLSSLLQMRSLRNMLAFYTPNTAGFAWGIIIIEFIIAALLFLPKTRKIGLISAIIATIYAGYVLLTNPHSPHDFGGILSFRSDREHIFIYS